MRVLLVEVPHSSTSVSISSVAVDSSHGPVGLNGCSSCESFLREITGDERSVQNSCDFQISHDLNR